ncbi:hypothetical protein AVEN_67862-1, partial [Araneus ventricosus]
PAFAATVHFNTKFDNFAGGWRAFEAYPPLGRDNPLPILRGPPDVNNVCSTCFRLWQTQASLLINDCSQPRPPSACITLTAPDKSEEMAVRLRALLFATVAL